MRITSPLFGRRLSVCEQCRWFKAVLLESGRTRRLCVLTGEKLRPYSEVCASFEEVSR